VLSIKEASGFESF